LDIPLPFKLENIHEFVSIPNLHSRNKPAHTENPFLAVKVNVSSLQSKLLTVLLDSLLKNTGIKYIHTVLNQQVLWKMLASVTLMQNMNSVYCEIVVFISHFHWLAAPVPS